MKFATKRIAAILCIAGLAGCAADRLHSDGIAAFDHGQYEEGIAKLEEATRMAPSDLSIRLDLRARKEAAIQQLITAADNARSAGQSDAAEIEYHRVLVIEPGNDRARRGLEGVLADRRHTERVAKAAKLFAAHQLDAAEAEVRAVLAEDPGFERATELAASIERERGPVSVTPHLKSGDNRPVSLQFRDAPTKMVFEVLARQTGINFIFDKDVKSDGKTTIFVSNAPVEQTIELILTQNQLARQVLTDNMVLVYPNTTAKQKDYQDEIVHTFYLANAAPKEAESMLKTVLASKTLFTDERSNTLVIRDTPEHVRMAQKLITSLDVPEAEVMMEVEILEVEHTLLDQIGINYPTSFSMAATSIATGDATGLVLSDLHKQTSDTIKVSPVGVSIDLLKQTGRTNTLASPRVRARNKEKAKILIGNRVPVITSGTSATTGGSYSTSSVQYIEVGLTLDVQPTIHVDGNVAIKMQLEVSSILKEIDVPTGNGGSTIAYQIGTRNTNTLLELKDGETQVLGGLISDDDRRTSSHIPGLGDLPILGRLFGSDGTTRDKTEIVLAITPRIIRAQTRPASETTEFWYGTESQTRSAPFGATGSTPTASTAPAPVLPGGVSYAGGGQTSAGAGPVVRAAPARIEAGTAAPAPAAASAPSDAAAVTTATVAPTAGAATAAVVAAGAAGVAGAEAKVETPAAPAAAGGKPSVTIDGPDSVKVGDEFGVTVRVSSAEALGRLRAQVRYDAGSLQLVSADPGDLATSGEAPKIDLKPGGVQLEANGLGNAAGGGSVVLLRLRAVGARPSATISTQVVLVGQDGVAIAATPTTPLTVTITQ